MENQQQEQAVHIEMERLNGEICAEPVPSHSSLCLKKVIITETVLLVAVISTCLLFFIFRTECLQGTWCAKFENHTAFVFKDIPSSAPAILTAQTPGKVNFTWRLSELNQRGQYDIFQVEKAAKYLIHGWVKRTTDVSEDVGLRLWDGEDPRTLELIKSEHFLYIKTERTLSDGNRIILYTSQHSDACFYIYEL